VLQHTVRATRVVIGIVLIILGALLSLPFVPGPGLLLVFGGLTVLSSEFEWARRWRAYLHDQFRRLTHRRSDMADEKDHLGDKLRDKERGEEESYFKKREKEALEKLRQKKAPDATEAPGEPGRK